MRDRRRKRAGRTTRHPSTDGRGKALSAVVGRIGAGGPQLVRIGSVLLGFRRAAPALRP